jgi:signal transduction histidine kinase/CheY-like chemotaxis protein
MKDIEKFKINIPVVAFAVALIGLVAAAYIMQLNKTVTANVNGTITELAEHDQNTIQNYVEETWEELDYIKDKFASYNCKSIVDAETLLNIECSNSRFSHIYLVAEDGIVYTDKLLFYDPSKEGQNGRINILPYFENNVDKVVARFDDKVPSTGIAKESVLYGIRLNNFSIDGKRMLGLVGISDLSNIQNKLIINSFYKNGVYRGYSSVIDTYGNYIVNEYSSVYLDETDNFFNHMENAQRLELSREEIAEKMSKNDTFSFSYTNSVGVDKIIYCKPFSDSDIKWYFMLSVQKNVFNERNRTFLILSMAMLVCIVFVVALLLTYVMRSHNKVLEATAQAKARSQFLANMSHEIRTPLNGIIGLIYLIEKEIDQPNKQDVIKSRLTKAANTADYLLSLINNILDVSKIQSDKIEISNEAIAPEIIADAVWSMQRSNIESRGVEFKLDCNIVAPWIIGDAILIKRVLMNIVGNAAKFTPAGGKIRLSVAQTKIDDTHVTTVFTCEDTGCGMSEDFLEHIWDSFSQERRIVENSEGGTGLGMTISKLLINAMGGEIYVKSKLNEGSTFTVVLPSEISPVAPVAQRTGGVQSNEDSESLKILLAEDNRLNAEILIDILESEGFEVIHAENGKEAVEKFVQSDIGELDVILMDMQMPIMDGCEATRKIRALDRADAKTIPIFACTANSFKEDRNRALESGMSYFLTKPIDVNEMLSKISGR